MPPPSVSFQKRGQNLPLILCCSHTCLGGELLHRISYPVASLDPATSLFKLQFVFPAQTTLLHVPVPWVLLPSLIISYRLSSEGYGDPPH